MRAKNCFHNIWTSLDLDLCQVLFLTFSIVLCFGIWQIIGNSLKYVFSECIQLQACISVGCVPTAHWPYYYVECTLGGGRGVGDLPCWGGQGGLLGGNWWSSLMGGGGFFPGEGVVQGVDLPSLGVFRHPKQTTAHPQPDQHPSDQTTPSWPDHHHQLDQIITPWGQTPPPMWAEWHTHVKTLYSTLHYAMRLVNIQQQLCIKPSGFFV